MLPLFHSFAEYLWVIQLACCCFCFCHYCRQRLHFRSIVFREACEECFALFFGLAAAHFALSTSVGRGPAPLDLPWRPVLFISRWFALQLQSRLLFSVWINNTKTVCTHIAYIVCVCLCVCICVCVLLCCTWDKQHFLWDIEKLHWQARTHCDNWANKQRTEWGKAGEERER